MTPVMPGFVRASTRFEFNQGMAWMAVTSTAMTRASLMPRQNLFHGFDEIFFRH